ncbi:hypothetical protein FE844_026820 (plasmid) [Rhizobium indicum]|uniref:hypothetical protein n=1 Tax=Rhizobium TaxID=379 RepID=UPI001105F287|nr:MULTISPECIES: hypothetical protein [Rhizobium]NNU64724.1 hypothetical protein [Rhizobium sp. WYCCWR 11152]QKK33201.1 hypothetical protein FE844_026820 [Rhizobium indicum]
MAKLTPSAAAQREREELAHLEKGIPSAVMAHKYPTSKALYAAQCPRARAVSIVNLSPLAREKLTFFAVLRWLNSEAGTKQRRVERSGPPVARRSRPAEPFSQAL